jgi:hypothetical protein
LRSPSPGLVATGWFTVGARVADTAAGSGAAAGATAETGAVDWPEDPSPPKLAPKAIVADMRLMLIAAATAIALRRSILAHLR